MKEPSIPYKNSKTSKLVFLLSILVSGCWLLGQVLNVYRFALVGAIFEIFWFPGLAMLFVLPILSIVMLFKEKANIKSLYVYSILFCVASILIMILGK
jgi:hypothetical protein